VGILFCRKKQLIKNGSWGLRIREETQSLGEIQRSAASKGQGVHYRGQLLKEIYPASRGAGCRVQF